jgi:hypothetical protein
MGIFLPNNLLIQDTKYYKAKCAMPSYLDNFRKRLKDKHNLINNLMGNGILCSKYYGIIENGSNTQIALHIGDIKKPPKEGGFGIEEFDRPCLDELLQMIQGEDGFIKVEKGGDKFSLTQKGINRCIELAIQQ